MIGFFRNTLALAGIILLAGCMTTNRKPNLLKAGEPEPNIGYLTGQQYLPAGGVYLQEPDIFANALYRLLRNYQHWEQEGAFVPRLPQETFYLSRVDNIDHVSGEIYGTFARELEVHLTVHDPYNPMRSRLVFEANLPQVGQILCGSFFMDAVGELANRRSEINARIQSERWRQGKRNIYDWARTQAERNVFYRFRPRSPERFQAGNNDFLCLKEHGTFVEVVDVLPPFSGLTPDNLKYYARLDPAAWEAAESTVQASIYGDPKATWTQSRLSRQGTLITACNSYPAACGLPYRGPTMLHHAILQDNGLNSGCWKVWVLSVGRWLYALDWGTPTATQSIFVRYIDCNGESPEPIPQAKRID